MVSFCPFVCLICQGWGTLLDTIDSPGVTTCQFKWSPTAFHSSEVTSNYDCSVKWRELCLGHQVHGLLPCAGQPRQEVPILPHHRHHIHLLLGYQGRQGDLASKEQEEPINSQEECAGRSSWRRNLNPTRCLLRRMMRSSVTTVKLCSRLEMVWKFTLERHTRKLSNPLRSCVRRLPNSPLLCLLQEWPAGLFHAITVVRKCLRHISARKT